MTLDVARGTVQCRHCGYVPLYDSNAPRNEPPPPSHSVDLRDVPIVSQQRPTARQESLFREGMQALKQGNRAEARRCFFDALELERSFIDPWLWLVSTTDDPAEQRQYIEWALGYEPNNLKAVEAMAVIEGRLDAGDVDPNLPRLKDIRRFPRGEPVKAQAVTTACPRCGGHLVYDIPGGALVCAHCNHRQVIAVEGYHLHSSLTEALLQRKYRPQYWEATDRVLTCNTCGAEVTMPPRALAESCFFCGSRHVIVADNAESFEQPDGIIPFTVTKDEAIDAVYRSMDSGIRRLTAFLRDPISHHEVYAIYLPFWAFDALVTVKWSYPGPVEDRGEYPYMMSDVLACASDTLDRDMLFRLEPFDLKLLQRYDPRYLSSLPAEIYRLDVDEASLNAREKMSREARGRVAGQLPSSKLVAASTGYGVGRDKAAETVHRVLSAHITQMTYRLVLLPVWNVILHEADGDARRALVNGQTGEVVHGGRLRGIV